MPFRLTTAFTLPNQLTILRIILTPFFVYSLFVHTTGYYIAAFVFFTVAAITDWYDGYFARKYNTFTDFGKFLDPLADKILVLSTFVSFYVLGMIKLWMVLVIATRDLVITLLRMSRMNTNAPFVTSKFAKWKTASQMTAIFIVLAFLILKQHALTTNNLYDIYSALENISMIAVLMNLVTFITAFSGLHYMIRNRRHVKDIANAFCRVFLPSM